MVCSPCTSYTVSRTEAVISSCQASPPARGVTNSPGRGICLDMWVPWASRVLVCPDSVAGGPTTPPTLHGKQGRGRAPFATKLAEMALRLRQRRRAP